MQCGVDVRAADRLDERADDVVVLVALPVVTDGSLVDGERGVVDRNLSLVLRLGRTGRCLKVGKCPTSVSPG